GRSDIVPIGRVGGGLLGPYGVRWRGSRRFNDERRFGSQPARASAPLRSADSAGSWLQTTVVRRPVPNSALRPRSSRCTAAARWWGCRPDLGTARRTAGRRYPSGPRPDG